MRNTIGELFRVTTFGESHGAAVGGVIDGCPSMFKIDLEELQNFVGQRKGGGSYSTQRQEQDEVEILSGLFDGLTTGAPIAFVVKNTDARSGDYDVVKNVYRPNHADYSWGKKYGIFDYRGGGRASARETVSRVVAGGIALQVLRSIGISVIAYTKRIGRAECSEIDVPKMYDNQLRCPDEASYRKMCDELVEAQREGDTLGGVVTCVITGNVRGLGEPLFGKLQASIAHAMMTIPAAKGFEYGDGFAVASMKGSECVDEYFQRNGETVIGSNHSGGIVGGISNGNDIIFNVAFKPIATLRKPVSSVSHDGEPVTLYMKGRHDVCVIPRVLPVVESMAALVLLDNVLQNKSVRL